MSLNTKNLSLKKPELTDAADITAYNENWDIVDETVKDLDDKVTNLKILDLEDNTANESNKRIKFALRAEQATKATYDGSGNNIGVMWQEKANITHSHNISSLKDDTSKDDKKINAAQWALKANMTDNIYVKNMSNDAFTNHGQINATNTDPGVGSQLANGYITLVYE